MKSKLKIEYCRDLGAQFRQNPHHMVGQDGAFTIPTRAGLLWFFGDTLIGARRPGSSLWYPDGAPVGPLDMSGKAGIERMVNNTGLLSTSQVGPEGISDFRYILDDQGEIKALIPLEADEDPDRVRVWCLHGVEIDNWIYLFFIKVVTIAEGLFPVNFRILGSGLAIGDAETWEFNRIVSHGSDIWWRENQPHFAAAILNPEGEFLYLYGALQGKDTVQRCYLARVKKCDIKRRERYEYLCTLATEEGTPPGAAAWAGGESEGSNGPVPHWSRRVGEAIPLFEGMPNELSVSWNGYLGCYLAVHSLDLTGRIVAHTAAAPWGPWSEPVDLYQVQVPHPAHLPYPQLIYAAKEHPALAQEGGRTIYITYIEFEEYFPHLVQVRFA
ncbi:MAG TPA: DUF4185 domain-containing protein [bacterium]|nr:DUF4185 domain-containing protein [bacterium]HPR87521.1 DUF4185 domain-containing protein [bacterium]